LCNISEAAVEASADSESDSSVKEGTNDSEVEVKEEDTTQAVELSSEQPRGLGNLLRNSKLHSVAFNSYKHCNIC
jgi:hypothetical protein